VKALYTLADNVPSFQGRCTTPLGVDIYYQATAKIPTYTRYVYSLRFFHACIDVTGQRRSVIVEKNMSQQMLLRQSVLQKFDLFHRYVHDTRLLPALVLSLAFIVLMAGNARPLNIFNLDTQVDVDQSNNTEVADTASAKPLTREMRAALEFVSRKHHVSADALEPAFTAAQSAAKQTRLDPLLIVAVISIESGFNPYAESAVGAQGLMQVMPRWHQDKIPDDMGATALFDPETNVRIGAQILQESIRHEGGLIAGLQQFAGARDDPELGYANKILARKRELESAVRRIRPATTVAVQ
jgi:Transglycosylase SLT domain